MELNVEDNYLAFIIVSYEECPKKVFNPRRRNPGLVDILIYHILTVKCRHQLAGQKR